MGEQNSQVRWGGFNSWCDDYAARHDGMKPKVEDVRRWHREFAEAVWPEPSERPSVFLAVSHNKGRRVRGSKTCEYYKRYRAGKAAEQQLAARMQPAAMSGRRILAVTAAARKLRTESARVAAKRLTSDESGADGEEDHESKRPRMHSLPSSARSARAAAQRARSMSDDYSDDDWPSGGDSSEDPQGESPSPVARRVPVSLAAGLVPPPHSGRHTTVVQPTAVVAPLARTGGVGAPAGSSGQKPPPHLTGGSTEGATARRRGGVSSGGNACSERYDSDAEGAHTDSDQSGWHALSGVEHQRGAPLEGQPLEPRPSRQPRHRRGSADLSADGQAGSSDEAERHADGLGGCSDGPHPGALPPNCRAPRSAAARPQRLPPRLAGYRPSPLGCPTPVYAVGAGASVPPVRVGRRPVRGSGSRGVAVPGICVPKDPLDLLAQAACEALNSPGAPAQGGRARAAMEQDDEEEEEEAGTGGGAAAAVALRARGAAGGQQAAAQLRRAEGSAQSGGGAPSPPTRRRGVRAGWAPPGRSSQGGSADPLAVLAVLRPEAGAEAPAGRSPSAALCEAGPVPSAFECGSGSTTTSGSPAAAAGPLHALGSPPRHLLAEAASTTLALPHPHRLLALPARGAPGWGPAPREGDGADAAGVARHDAAPPRARILTAAVAATSSAAAAPSGVTATLPVPAAMRSYSAGATSAGPGAGPGRALSAEEDPSAAFSTGAAHGVAGGLGALAGPLRGSPPAQQPPQPLAQLGGLVLPPLLPLDTLWPMLPLLLPGGAGAPERGPPPPISPEQALWSSLAAGVAMAPPLPPALASAASLLGSAGGAGAQLLPMMRLLQMGAAAAAAAAGPVALATDLAARVACVSGPAAEAMQQLGGACILPAPQRLDVQRPA